MAAARLSAAAAAAAAAANLAFKPFLEDDAAADDAATAWANAFLFLASVSNNCLASPASPSPTISALTSTPKSSKT
jgi:hypothetical protein